MFYIELYQRTSYETFTCGSTRNLSLEKEFFPFVCDFDGMVFCFRFRFRVFVERVIYQRCFGIQLDIYMFMVIFKRPEDFRRVKSVELFNKVQPLGFRFWLISRKARDDSIYDLR